MADPNEGWPTWEQVMARPEWRNPRFSGSRVLMLNNIHRERAVRPTTLTVERADEEIRGHRWRNTGQRCIALWCAVLDAWWQDAKAAKPQPKLCDWCGGEIEDSEACVSWTWNDEACVAHFECYSASRKLRPGEEWTHGDFARGCLCQNGACECGPKAATPQPAQDTCAKAVELDEAVRMLDEAAVPAGSFLGRLSRLLSQPEPNPLAGFPPGWAPTGWQRTEPRRGEEEGDGC